MEGLRSSAAAVSRSLLGGVVVAAIAWSSARAQVVGTAAPPPGRLQELRAEITTLRGELERMAGRERGLLGELERLGTELSLREAEQAEAALRSGEMTETIARHDANLARLDHAQEERRRYLEFRLREIYKAGEHDGLRRLLGSPAEADAWTAVTYASYLSRRDAEVLGAYRTDSVRSAEERRALEDARDELLAIEAELGRASRQLEASRNDRQAALDRLRDDQRTRRSALGELEAAAAELEQVVGGIGDEGARGGLDVRKFQGLLDWPGAGPVTSGFGRVVHPRFRTEVPHPGIDIDAPLGSDIRAAFEGQVVFAEWMRGYGLTAILDHGHGVLTIYAHASVLIVEAGDRVAQGQLLGKVGETGSLRGPYLYFELRVDGDAKDPLPWLAPR